MATLQNLTKVVKTLNIPCPAACAGKRERAEDCLCSEVTTSLVVTLEDGTTGIKEVTRRLAGSITLLAGATLEVPEWVAKSPVVARAVASKVIRLVEPKKPEPVTAPSGKGNIVNAPSTKVE